MGNPLQDLLVVLGGVDLDIAEVPVDDLARDRRFAVVFAVKIGYTPIYAPSMRTKVAHSA